MADDDQGEKSEDPTDQRRREARNQGNVAKSVDVNAAAIMLAATGGLMFLGPDIAKGFAGLLRRYLEGPPVLELDRFMVMREFWNILNVDIHYGWLLMTQGAKGFGNETCVCVCS